MEREFQGYELLLYMSRRRESVRDPGRVKARTCLGCPVDSERRAGRNGVTCAGLAAIQYPHESGSLRLMDFAGGGGPIRTFLPGGLGGCHWNPSIFSLRKADEWGATTQASAAPYPSPQCPARAQFSQFTRASPSSSCVAAKLGSNRSSHFAVIAASSTRPSASSTTPLGR